MTVASIFFFFFFFFVNGKQCKKNMDYQQSVVSVVLIKNASSFGCTG